MSETIVGAILDVKLNKDDLEIFLVVDANGERKTRVIKSEQLIHFDTDRVTKQNIMLQYYNAFKERQKKGLNVRLEEEGGPNV